MTYVVDARVAIKWFVDEAGSARADSLLVETTSFVAPDLILLEKSNILWKKHRLGFRSRP
jgi:hypothetical protein